jgi:hypothetical protein
LPNPEFHTHTCFLFVLLRSYTKSLITKPQNVFVLRDIMCNGYVAGGNCKFFGFGGKTKVDGPVSAAEVQAEIQQRLAYADDIDADYASMLAFLCPYNEVEVASRDQVISLSERLLPWEVVKGAGSSKTDGGFPGGAAGFDLYKGYGLNQIHFGEDVRAAENMEFVANVSCYSHAVFAFIETLAQMSFVCIRFYAFTGFHEQCYLHPRPAPQVQPLFAELLRARAGSGPLWPR